MKKTIIVLVPMLLLSIVFCISACSAEQEPEKIDELLQTKTYETLDLSAEQETAGKNEATTNDVFDSVWPDELPKNEISEFSPDGGRPIQFKVEIEPGKWAMDFNYASMYLYDFPDPEPDFHIFGTTFIHEIKEIIFKYDKVTDSEDGLDEQDAVSSEDFNAFINNLIAAGYTDNSERTDTAYYCEKYGVGITVVLSNEFPFADDDPKLRPMPTLVDCCYVRLQLIDPDYVMDLEAIKAEEYQKWLETH